MGRGLFGTSGGSDNGRPTDASPTLVRIWLVAAAALVAGILIGFASGFTAGKRVNEPGVVSAPPAAAGDSTGSGQAFSEEAVPNPDSGLAARDVEPIVPTREPVIPASQKPTAEPGNRESRIPGPEPPIPNPQARPTGPGSIQVVSRPSGAEVILDGRSVGRTPLSIAEVPDGAHNIRLDLPGFRRWATSVEVAAGQRTRVAASLEQ